MASDWMTLKLANSLDWIEYSNRKMTSNTSTKEFLLLKVDEDSLDLNLESLMDYSDQLHLKSLSKGSHRAIY
jgi:hypothetical protein